MKTQAWGWLAAGVVAAALNASYHDGGLRWAHGIVNQVKHNSHAVLALATGQADQFMTEAQLASVRHERSSCPLAAALAEARTMVTDQDPQVVVRDSDAFDESDFAVMTERQQAALAQLEAQRARIDAQVARIRIPAVAMRPVVVRVPEVSVCPRVRMRLRRMPAIKIPPMPQVHVDTGMGPI